MVDDSLTDEEDGSESDSEALLVEGDCIVVGVGIASSGWNRGCVTVLTRGRRVVGHVLGVDEADKLRIRVGSIR